jgi:hypothetical protein
MSESEIQEGIEKVIARQWQRLPSAGTWFTGEQRVAIARVVRQAQAGQEVASGGLPDVIIEAASKIAIDAHTIEQGWVEQCFDRGLTPLQMVELTAIVAQLSTIDTYTIGIGEALRELPEPLPGDPGREEVKGAKLTRGWYPTRGVAGAPNCFSAVAAENKALHEIHEAMYLDMQEMADVSIVKSLHRSQIELLAARTSNYNDCFY